MNKVNNLEPDLVRNLHRYGGFELGKLVQRVDFNTIYLREIEFGI